MEKKTKTTYSWRASIWFYLFHVYKADNYIVLSSSVYRNGFCVMLYGALLCSNAQWICVVAVYTNTHSV